MKISQILLQDGYRLSFEVFPPKKSTGLENVRKATEEIAKLEPSFVSVTYGAGGGTSDFTLDIAKNIKEQTGVPVLAHITCVSSSREKVASYIDALKASGIENVMALRGDLTPEMESQDRSGWDYRNAYQLVEELKAAGDFCIGGACYPEVHPESSCRNEDILHLKEKVKAIVCMGVDNTKIHEAFEGIVGGANMTDTLSAEEAVQAASRFAADGDVVLLSPCCASFDLFANYEDRGDKFKEAVRNL